MIVRATKKLLNTSGIKPVKNLNESNVLLPGEWYAGLVSTGRQGKMLIHFFHSSTKLSILCPGKSLNKALPVFPERLEQLLRRLGYSRLIFQFQVHTKPEIYATNSRSLLAHMNQMKYAIEYRVALAEQLEMSYCINTSHSQIGSRLPLIHSRTAAEGLSCLSIALRCLSGIIRGLHMVYNPVH